jgi:polysaccharide chain length determinant protein (PEP-CTERM system associated)
MDAVRLMLSTYLRAAWRRRWLGVAVAWLVCCIGWVGTYAIPNQFESNARLFVDADAILTPLLRGIAADSTPTTQLEILQRTLLSKPNMEKVISKTDLDLMLNRPSDRERMIIRLANDIKVTPQTKNLFTISYRDSNPRLAHDVVQTLLTIFIEAATGTNRTDMENARRFLERQIQSFEQQLRAAEKRRADFRVRYMEILPNDLNPNVGALEAARTAVTTVSNKLQDTIIQRDSLRQEVENTPPMLVAEGGVYQPGGMRKTRLQEAQDTMQGLQLRYTDQHPDVIAQRKLIEYLKAHPDDGDSAVAADTKNSPSGKTGSNDPAAGTTTPRRSVPNPVYDQLKIKLIEADTQVASLTRQQAEALRAQDRLEKISREQPGLFAEYQNMDRDYNVLRKKYEDLLGLLQSANIAQAADTQADKVKLQIIDPPEVPRIPSGPNRPLLVTGVLLAGVAIGLGITVLFGQLDQSFASVDQLRTLGLPVLGGISILGMEPLRRRMMAALRFSAAVTVLMAVYGAVMVHILRSAALI